MLNNNIQAEVSAVVLLNNNYDALLQLRDVKKGLSASGLWVFPGGHRELNEDIRSCAFREFLEETGYECENLQWLISLEDSFISMESKYLHIFWDSFNPKKTYKCLEGQALEFIERRRGKDMQIPEYLLCIWDLVILAAKKGFDRG